MADFQSLCFFPIFLSVKFLPTSWGHYGLYNCQDHAGIVCSWLWLSNEILARNSFYMYKFLILLWPNSWDQFTKA